MARKKQEAEPLLAHKHAFVESLDNVVQQSIMLLSAIDTILVHEPGLKGADILKERVAAFRKSIFNEE